MGIIGGLIKLIVKWAIYFSIFALILVLVPGIPPHVKFTEVNLPKTRVIDEKLIHPGALNNAERLFDGKIHGPEGFSVYNGELYTGLVGGELVKVSGPHATFVTKIGLPCEGFWQERKCGRPLGFKFSKDGQLYIVDSYYGIWKVDPKTDKKHVLVSPSTEIEGVKPVLFNSIALSSNGDFYWTHSSSDFTLDDGLFTLLADGSGRLLHYDAATKKNKVLLDGLWFANGLAVSPDGTFVVVAETSGLRIGKIYVKGPKKGQKEIFIDGLPGSPDNIQPLEDGSGMLVGMFMIEEEHHPMLHASMAPFPALRKLASRFLRLIQIPFEFANQQFPHYVFESVTHFIGHFNSFSGTIPQTTGIMKVDWNGNIVGLWTNTDGSYKSISDAIVYNGKMYLGSPFTPALGRVPVPEGLLKEKSQEQKKFASDNKQAPKTAESPKPTAAPKVTTEAPKPTTQAPKPTTQAPKPTTEAPKPTTQAPKPTTEAPKPTTQAPKPTTEAPKPTTQAPKPTTQAPKPTTQAPKPATETKTPPKPVKENIPSDTKAPSQEKLKVITKDGPAVVPPARNEL